MSTASQQRVKRRLAGTRDQNGVAAVWMALVLFLLLGCAAIAVDLVNGYFQAWQAQNAADAASLGGVVFLPDMPSASGNALEIAEQNGYKNDGDTTVTATPGAGEYELEVKVRRRFPTFFASVMGFDTLTVSESATVTYDPPNEITAPLDLFLILDRTRSMIQDPHRDALAKAKVAAHALLDSLDPSLVNVAMGLTGPSSTTECAGGGYGVPQSASAGGLPDNPIGPWLWVVSPYSGGTYGNPTNDYTDPNSQVRKTINCLSTIDRVNTNLGDPVEQARIYMSTHRSSPDAKQAIILMTDGEANEPNRTSCQYAFDKAKLTKDTTQIEIVTIGFGVEGHICGPPSFGNEDPSAHTGVQVTQLLADMASGNDDGTAADDDLSCTDLDAEGKIPENTDGDNFFCVPKDEDLAEIFVLAAEQLAAKRSPRLIK